METISKTMRVEGNNIYISRYEIIEAFFRTEEEEDENMANELNKMINVFCEAERKTRRNVSELPFDANTHKNVIDYISKISVK